MTEHKKRVKNTFLRESSIGFFINKPATILLARSSDCQNPTSNQIEPNHLFLPLSDYTTPLPLPQPTVIGEGWHTKCKYDQSKAY